MKKIIVLLLCSAVMAGCGTASPAASDSSTSSAEVESVKKIYDSDGHRIFTCSEYGNQIPYEDGTVAIEDVYFLETKNGAYYDTTAAVFVDFSGLSEDERQWFVDEYDNVTTNISMSLYLDRGDDGDDIEHFSKVGATTGTIRDGEPVFMIFFSRSGEKYSLAGEEYGIQFMVTSEEAYDTYIYSGEIAIASPDEVPKQTEGVE